MKATELFRKKIDYFFGKVSATEKLFYEKVIYKDKLGSTGLTIEELEKVVPEILAHDGVRIIGVETVNEHDEFRCYNWEKFDNAFNFKWIYTAMELIEAKDDNPICSIFIDIPKSQIMAINNSIMSK